MTSTIRSTVPRSSAGYIGRLTTLEGRMSDLAEAVGALGAATTDVATRHQSAIDALEDERNMVTAALERTERRIAAVESRPAAFEVDHEELALQSEPREHLPKTADVRIVERRIDLVEDREWAWVDLVQREHQRKRGERTLARGQERHVLQTLARRLNEMTCSTSSSVKSRSAFPW